MVLGFVFVAAMMLIGSVLRQKVGLFRTLYIPASVVGGLVGLLLIQTYEINAWVIEVVDSMPLEFERTLDGSPEFPQAIEKPKPSVARSLGMLASKISLEISRWPGFLIAVVFAGMLMLRKPTSAKESARRVSQQALMVWIIVLGQTAVGLVATWLIVQRFCEVPNSFGMLIESGFAGGHGTAAAMAQVYANPKIGLPSGGDLAMLMATGGLVYGVVSGVVWLNIGVRAGWVSAASIRESESAADTRTSAIALTPESLQSKQSAIGDGSDKIDPVLFHVMLLAFAVGLGLMMQGIVLGIAGAIDSRIAGEISGSADPELLKRMSVSNIVDFPLFIYTLFGGLFVHKILKMLGKTDLVSGKTVNRLTSIAMDILVVAAIASLNLKSAFAMIVPFSILFVCGAIWTAVCLLLISRWILPKEHWFQLALINYGMSTGTTATGFVLLRMVDPKLESGAAEDYALAAPFSAPFIGGGMITFALPLLMLENVSIALPAIFVSVTVVGLVFIGRRFRIPDAV